MSILVIFEATVEAENVAAAEGIFAQLLPETRTKDGCEAVSLHQDVGAPGTIALVERWTTREQYDTYTAWRASQGDPLGLGALLTAPPVVRYFSDLQA